MLCDGGRFREVERLKREATGAKRDAILWVKDVWHQRAEYPYTVGGIDIYTAVLDNGVRTPDEFAAHLQRRDAPDPSRPLRLPRPP